MTNLRSRFEVAAGTFIVAGGLFAMGLIVYASWINLFAYFRFTGRDPDGFACATVDVLQVVLFVWVNTYPYRVLRLFVTSFRETAKERRSTHY